MAKNELTLAENQIKQIKGILENGGIATLLEDPWDDRGNTREYIIYYFCKEDEVFYGKMKYVREYRWFPASLSVNCDFGGELIREIKLFKGNTLDKKSSAIQCNQICFDDADEAIEWFNLKTKNENKKVKFTKIGDWQEYNQRAISERDKCCPKCKEILWGFANYLVTDLRILSLRLDLEKRRRGSERCTCYFDDGKGQICRFCYENRVKKNNNN